jgi:YVTN family beta-propeller protein
MAFSLRTPFFTMVIVATMAALTGCDQTPPAGGFLVETTDTVDIAGLPVAYPHGNVAVSGTFVQQAPNTLGTYGAVKSFPTTYTDLVEGQFVVADGVTNAIWNSTATWNQLCGVQIAANANIPVLKSNPVLGWTCDYTGRVSSTQPSFVTPDAIPMTLTVMQQGFSTQYGLPVLTVYAQDRTFVNSLSAASVAADGSSATFPFPSHSNGSSLSSGMYIFTVRNIGPGSATTLVGPGFFSVGSHDTSQTSPFGVAVINGTASSSVCSSDPSNPGIKKCAYGSGPYRYPLTTLAAAGQVNNNGVHIAVGGQPVAVGAFATSSNTTTSTSGSTTRTIIKTQPSRALVANFASSTVSLVNLFSNSVLSTISVGAEPCAVIVSPDQTKAYVANYGSSSVSEVDLSIGSQSRLVTVGPQPATLALDASGTSLWVGGLNYVSRLDLSSFSVVATLPSVSGQVTSVTVSGGQNSVLYTTISNSYSTFQAVEANLTAGGTTTTRNGSPVPEFVLSNPPHVYSQVSVANTAYSNPNSGGGTPPGFLASSGALVSASYGNAAVVVGTPNGFAVIDLKNHVQIMQGSTSSPIRGIATDSGQGVVYLAAPDSNSLYYVPMPIPQTVQSAVIH